MQIYDDINNAEHLRRIFPDTKKLILAPMEAGDTVYGVLCIRSSSPRPFPGNVRLIAGLLGQQLGLYHSLLLQIRNLQDAERRNRQLIETQHKLIGDVHHQVKSPIISSHRIASMLRSNSSLPYGLRQEAERIRGMTSKVSRVVRNMGMFSDLSSGQRIRLKYAVLKKDQLTGLLRESCDNHQSLIDPDRRIKFKLDEKSFEDVTGHDMSGKLVEADWALLDSV